MSIDEICAELEESAEALENFLKGFNVEDASAECYRAAIAALRAGQALRNHCMDQDIYMLG